MEIAFETQKLRTLCERKQSARETFGPDLAMLLQLRIAEIRAAESCQDLLDLQVAAVGSQGENSPQIIVEMGERQRLVLVPSGRLGPRNSRSTVEWRKVKRLKLISIEEVKNERD